MPGRLLHIAGVLSAACGKAYRGRRDQSKMRHRKGYYRLRAGGGGAVSTVHDQHYQTWRYFALSSQRHKEKQHEKGLVFPKQGFVLGVIVHSLLCISLVRGPLMILVFLAKTISPFFLPTVLAKGKRRGSPPSLIVGLHRGSTDIRNSGGSKDQISRAETACVVQN